MSAAQSQKSFDVRNDNGHIVKFPPLDSAESEHLAHLEEIIRARLPGFLELGGALLEIKEKRLYRSAYDSFEEYCKNRWALGRSHAYRLLEGAVVMQHLSPIGDIPLPQNECQVRALAGLPQRKVQQAWQEACHLAKGGPVTGRIVEQAVQKVSRKKPAEAEPWRETWQIQAKPLLREALIQLEIGNKDTVLQIVSRINLLLEVGNRPAAAE